MQGKKTLYDVPRSLLQVIKQYFNEKGIGYKEVDVGINEKEFYELIRFYGKGPLPVIVEDGKIVPLTQVMQNVQVMFSGVCEKH